MRATILERVAITTIFTLMCATAGATPITYAVRADTSYLTANSTGTGVVNPHNDQRLVGASSASSSSSFTGIDNRIFNLTSSVNLGQGALKVTNNGTGGASTPVSGSVTSSIAEYLDTFTILGNFSSPILVPFTATFDGDWTQTNTDFVGLFGQVWFGTSATVEDWSNPSNNPGQDLYDKDALFKSFASDFDGEVALTISGNLELSGLNPSFVAWLRMEAAVFSTNSQATWTGDFANTGTLEFDFTGFTVTSASGVFPGTSRAVPEPGTIGLAALGLCALALGRRRRAGPSTV
jgi:hypothetical protein